MKDNATRADTNQHATSSEEATKIIAWKPCRHFEYLFDGVYCHPHQQVVFNIIAGKILNKYWQSTASNEPALYSFDIGVSPFLIITYICKVRGLVVHISRIKCAASVRIACE